MSGSLNSMYQQLILEHAKHPNGKTELTENLPHDASSYQKNPTCGDEVTLWLTSKLDDAGELVICEIHWDGQGCSISQASLSVMTELLEGKRFSQADEISEVFLELMNSKGKGIAPEAEDELGDAAAFVGVSVFPARIKCALLGWSALKDATLKSKSNNAATVKATAGSISDHC